MSLPPSISNRQAQVSCCLLTAAGRGAVAVVATTGDRKQQIIAIDRLFKPIGSRSFKQIPEQPIVYGQWLSTGEDLVVCTSPIGFEIQCHGGNAASAAIIGDLEKLGFRPTKPADLQRSTSSPWRVETEQAICQATTERTANFLLNVLKIQDAALRELQSLSDFNALESTANKMLQWAKFGQRLTQPRAVVFCGQPNVGKSSLVNAIAGFERAIVNKQAGTTRDVLTQAAAIAGWPVSLTDTAGLRDTAGEIEKLGIEKAQRAIHGADLRIAVFDATKPLDDSDRSMLESLNVDLIVLNKIDLLNQSKLTTGTASPALVCNVPAVEVSALDRTGLERLINTIAGMLVPELPPPHQWYPVTASQKRMLQLLIEKLSRELRDENQNLD